ncbi:MAG: glycosyltransferase [Bauldia sp.]|nr:glycosyltransferase [Bauldia sp.]MCW5717129.1 glycosyltransferase [Bauldia sp.]
MTGSRSPALQATHVIAGLAAAHGGPSYSVPRLVEALRRLGLDVELLSVVTGPPPAGLPPGTRFFPRSFGMIPLLNRFAVSTELRRALMKGRGGASVIHGHGLWLKPNLDVAAAARRRRVPLIVSPRGMLAPEARGYSRTRKALVWWLGQRRALEGAACIHATSASEHDDIRALGLKAPVAVIRNGIDLPERRPEAGDRGARTTVLSLGRIHPKKGLASLVEAWALVEGMRPDWRLRIVGPDENGHAGELRQLAARSGLRRVSIEDAVYDEGKAQAFREAGLFVLPSRNENFGLSAAEALAAGVPVIATRGTPWSGLVSEMAGWWVDGAPPSLADALREATARPAAELAAMGDRGRAWMERDFGWDRVAAEMREVYRWLLSGGTPPSTVVAR